MCVPTDVPALTDKFCYLLCSTTMMRQIVLCNST